MRNLKPQIRLLQNLRALHEKWTLQFLMCEAEAVKTMLMDTLILELNVDRNSFLNNKFTRSFVGFYVSKDTRA